MKKFVFFDEDLLAPTHSTRDLVKKSILNSNSFARVFAKAVNCLKQGQVLTVANYSEKLGLNQRTAWQHLNDLTKAGFLKRTNAKRGARFIPQPVLLDDQLFLKKIAEFLKEAGR